MKNLQVFTYLAQQNVRTGIEQSVHHCAIAYGS